MGGGRGGGWEGGRQGRRERGEAGVLTKIRMGTKAPLGALGDPPDVGGRGDKKGPEVRGGSRSRRTPGRPRVQRSERPSPRVPCAPPAGHGVVAQLGARGQTCAQTAATPAAPEAPASPAPGACRSLPAPRPRAHDARTRAPLLLGLLLVLGAAGRGRGRGAPGAGGRAGAAAAGGGARPGAAEAPLGGAQGPAAPRAGLRPGPRGGGGLGPSPEQRVEIVPRDLRMKDKFLKHLTGPLYFSPKCSKHFHRLYHNTRDCTIPAYYKRCARLLTRLAVSPVCMEDKQ
uniref:ALK and LTK ligand 2 n=2 Tax=Catarrhini TaxID=9526 RepID=A0A7N9CB98_MACFA